MIEKVYATPKGNIRYWVSLPFGGAAVTLVLLPGLTADHRLFEKQVEAFEGRYNLLTWDAPGHNLSWPFQMDIALPDKARWLYEILEAEAIARPVLVGQSMGGYVAQCFAQQYPQRIKGFVSIDSAPLQKRYVTGIERWLLKKMEPVYLYYPWKPLKKLGTEGVATTAYGRALMTEMMETYEGDQKRYAALAGRGYRMLAQAMDADLPYEIPCPAALICGEKDHAGSCIRYNKAWHKHTGLPLYWIKGAGHNSNTDAPAEVNAIIEQVAQEAL